jgi:hypothetical protein
MIAGTVQAAKVNKGFFVEAAQGAGIRVNGSGKR